MQGNTLQSEHQSNLTGRTHLFSPNDILLFHQLNNKGSFSQCNYYKKNICFYKMLHVLTLKGHHQVHINRKKGCHIF